MATSTFPVAMYFFIFTVCFPLFFSSLSGYFFYYSECATQNWTKYKASKSTNQGPPAGPLMSDNSLDPCCMNMDAKLTDLHIHTKDFNFETEIFEAELRNYWEFLRTIWFYHTRGQSTAFRRYIQFALSFRFAFLWKQPPHFCNYL